MTSPVRPGADPEPFDPVDRPSGEPAAELVVRPAHPVGTLHWRTALLLASAFVTVLLASATMLLPVPYVVLQPGPAINTLGTADGHALISVKGHPTYPAKGQLDLTTVTVSGGPGTRLPVYSVIRGWLAGERSVVPERVMYPPGETVESSRQENQQEMVSSQEAATVAALHELGIEVPTTITVHSVDPGTPASPLRAGDVIVAVERQRVADLEALNSIMKTVTPGDTVALAVRRAGVETQLRAPTRRYDDGRAILGIRVDPTFHPPFEVTIRIGNVGGPSAGTMFALGIVDLLTPGDLTGGKHVAGTGTITENGEVGAIGGIAEKMAGARRAGAAWFLAPGGNCQDVEGHVPGGLRVVRIDTLHQARAAVEAIAAGRTAALPTCS